MNLAFLDYFAAIFKHQTKSTMKKLLAILAVAGVMTACNNSGDKEKSTSDSTSTMTTDTTSKMSTDTTNKMMADTTKKDTSAKK